MIVIAYRIDTKEVIRKFHNIYEVEDFYRKELYEKKASDTWAFYPMKFLPKIKLSYAFDLVIVRRGWKRYVAKDGLNINLYTLYSLSRRKQIPTIRIGKLVRYDRDEVEKWLEEKKVKTEK